MTETVTVSLSFDEAARMEREHTLRPWIEFRGIDTTKPMLCRKDGDRIVYEDWPLLTSVNPGDVVTKGNCKRCEE